MSSPSPATMALLVNFLHKEALTSSAVALRRAEVRSPEAFSSAPDSVLINCGVANADIPRLRVACRAYALALVPPLVSECQVTTGSPLGP
eukprot:866219-Heterocapsa_arctica.AAC.1